MLMLEERLSRRWSMLSGAGLSPTGNALAEAMQDAIAARPSLGFAIGK
jgi:hypothetical protein